MPKGPVSFQLEQAVGDRPVILLFAPSERSPAYESQIPLLDDATLRELHPLLVRVFTDGDSYAGDERIDDAVLRLVADLGGQVAAEHGIGNAKSRWLTLARSPQELATHVATKHALDPEGVLNPGVLSR